MVEAQQAGPPMTTTVSQTARLHGFGHWLRNELRLERDQLAEAGNAVDIPRMTNLALVSFF